MPLPQFNNESHDKVDFEQEFILSFEEEEVSDEDYDSDSFLGIGVDSHHSDNSDFNLNDEEFNETPLFNVDNIDVEEDSDSEEEEEEDEFELVLENFTMEEEDEEDGEEEEEDNSDKNLQSYQETLSKEPETKPEIRKSYDKKQELHDEKLNIDKVSNEEEALTPNDFKLLTTHRTIYKVDMRNGSDKKGTPLANSNVNRVTKRRDYSRDEFGVLSPDQIRYFTTLSKVNMSNARYPEEYINLARSNEDLLEVGQSLHRRIVKGFISLGIDEDARDRVKDKLYKKITRGDEEILELVARLKYMSTMQICRGTKRTKESVQLSLTNLRARKLIKNADSPYYNQRMWCLTDLGMSISNYDLNPPNTKGISLSMLQHTTVVNNVACYIHSGTVNVLGMEDFPPRRRINSFGRVVAGEDFVSETQLRSSLGRVVNKHSFSGIKGEVYIPLIQNEINKQFDDWEKTKNERERKHSPEREFGNEYMWVLFPPPYLGIYQHIPDLIVPRDRNDDGTPESVAIEVELRSKTLEDYIRTLKVYENDTRMYKKVVWICSKQRTANLLIKAAEHTNLLSTGKLEIMPIETEIGVFKGNNVLSIG